MADWARTLIAAGESAGAVARYSHEQGTRRRAHHGGLALLAEQAEREIERVAACGLIDLGLPVDRQAVQKEADAYLPEVEAEDDGFAHARDAIAALLKARLGGNLAQQSPPGLLRHSAEILAPLLAQAACLTGTVRR